MPVLIDIACLGHVIQRVYTYYMQQFWNPVVDLRRNMQHVCMKNFNTPFQYQDPTYGDLKNTSSYSFIALKLDILR